MKKKVGIIKRLFCLLLIFLLSINSFAAIVSDNDGSAFITKAEFDALKSSFQSQIDSYNQSIDSKIDGAIASYLAGIKLSAHFELDNIYEKYNINGGTGKLRWRYGNFKLNSDTKHPIAFLGDAGVEQYQETATHYGWTLMHIEKNVTKPRYYLKNGTIAGSGEIEALVDAFGWAFNDRYENAFISFYGDNSTGDDVKHAYVDAIKTRYRGISDVYVTHGSRTSGQRFGFVRGTLKDSVKTDRDEFVLAPCSVADEEVWNFDTNTVEYGGCGIGSGGEEASLSLGTTGTASVKDFWGLGPTQVLSTSRTNTDKGGFSGTWLLFEPRISADMDEIMYGKHNTTYTHHPAAELSAGASLPVSAYIASGSTTTIKGKDMLIGPLISLCPKNGPIERGLAIAENTAGDGTVKVQFTVDNTGWVMIWSGADNDVNWGPHGRTSADQFAYKNDINRVTAGGTYTRELPTVKNDIIWIIYLPSSEGVSGKLTISNISVTVDN